MVAISHIALFALGASAGVVKRTVAQVLTDLKKTTTDVNTLTTALNNYSGSISGVVPIQQDVNTVLSDIKTTNTDVTNTAQANDADSSSLISYINASLEPAISSAVAALINQKSKLIAAGGKSIVQNDVSYLKGNTTTLGNNLVSKASTGTKSAASAAFSKVIADLNKAQAAFA